MLCVSRLTAGSLRPSMETHRVMGIVWVVWTVLACVLLPVRMQVTVHAVVGQDTLLPCVCPPTQPGHHYLVWQIGQHTTVDYAIAKVVKNNIDPQYLNRTRLFNLEERGNCSLLLHSVRVSDQKMYSCHYDQFVNFTVALEVTAHYSLQCTNDRGGGQYQCTAHGGFPKGRIYWLQDGLAVEDRQGSQSELYHQDHLTGLYNITSTLRTSRKSASLRCVVEDPATQHNITTNCTQNVQASKEPLVSVELKASLAACSVLLILATVFIIVLLKVWKPCPSSKAAGPYALAPLA